jgi:cytochrome P450
VQKVSEDNFLTPLFFQNPYPFYQILQEQEPVFWSEKKNAWMVTQYVDVSDGLRDPRLSVKRNAIRPVGLPNSISEELDPLRAFYSLWLMYLDPPTHTRLRKIANKAFTNQFVEDSKPAIKAVIEQTMSTLRANGYMEIMSEFASPFTVAGLASLLGIPEGDYPLVQNWSQKLVGFLGLGQFDLAKARETQQAYLALRDYLTPFIAYRRTTTNATDLLFHLVNAQEHGQGLSDEELLATYANILIDGHEPIAYTVVAGMRLLLSNRDQYQQLVQNPSLIANAVEEIVRFEPPFQYAGRIAKEDLSIGGKLIKKGDKVLLMLGAANHDPAIFADPGSFDITRQVQKHRAFGFGTHYCLGAPFALAVLPEAFSSLLQLPELRLMTQEFEWLHSLGYRKLQSLQVEWTVRS